MKIVVLGNTGLIGRKVVHILEELGHDAGAASTGTIDLLTGRGLNEAFRGAQSLVILPTRHPSRIPRC